MSERRIETAGDRPRATLVSERLRFGARGGCWFVAGTYMPASALLEMMAHGATAEQIVMLCPYLSIADIRACHALGAVLTGGPVVEADAQGEPT